MKRILILILALMLALSSAAFAFDPSRFMGINGVKVEIDAANPEKYSVTYGFSDSAASTHAGGHMLIRYKNLGKAEELPLILVSFTSSGVKGKHISIRTDSGRYEAVCTDLASAGLSAVETEATLLVTNQSRDMLGDIATSAFVMVSIWDEDPAQKYTFMVPGAQCAMLQLFLNEYDAEIIPMITEGGNLEKVYNTLTPAIEAESAPSIANEARAIMAAEYDTLKNGSQGDAVQRLQQTLIDMGLLTGSADGIYGKGTAAAVKTFQASAGLDETGKADAATQAALYLMQLANAGEEAPAEEVPAEEAQTQEAAGEVTEE